MLIIVPVHECADQIDINDGKNDDDNNLQGATKQATALYRKRWSYTIKHLTRLSCFRRFSLNDFLAFEP